MIFCVNKNVLFLRIIPSLSLFLSLKVFYVSDDGFFVYSILLYFCISNFYTFLVFVNTYVYESRFNPAYIRYSELRIKNQESRITHGSTSNTQHSTFDKALTFKLTISYSTFCTNFSLTQITHNYHYPFPPIFALIL